VIFYDIFVKTGDVIPASLIVIPVKTQESRTASLIKGGES
jgi:hypothetical protein